jgi:Family of unknown function (DUF6116)
VFSPAVVIRNRALKWASELRFPTLLALTVAVFVVDLLVPDLIPFVDELLLGFATLLLALLRKKRRESRTTTETTTGPARSPAGVR